MTGRSYTVSRPLHDEQVSAWSQKNADIMTNEINIFFLIQLFLSYIY